MRRLAPAICAITLGCLSFAAPVAASPPRPHRLGVSVNVASFTINEETAPQGGVLALDYEYFFASAFAVRVSAGGGYFSADENSYSAHAVVGMTYALDSLEDYVPWGGVGIGQLWLSDERVDPRRDFYVEGAGGLDVIVNRNLAIGLTVRLEVQLSRASYLAGGLRVLWRWR